MATGAGPLDPVSEDVALDLAQRIDSAVEGRGALFAQAAASGAASGAGAAKCARPGVGQGRRGLDGVLLCFLEGCARVRSVSACLHHARAVRTAPRRRRNQTLRGHPRFRPSRLGRRAAPKTRRPAARRRAASSESEDESASSDESESESDAEESEAEAERVVKKARTCKPHHEPCSASVCKDPPGAST